MGEAVEIRFKNISNLPKISLGYSLVFPKKGIASISFGGKEANTGTNATNILPDSVKDDVLACGKFLGPIEKGVIKLIAPSESGAYQLLFCFPGP